MTIRTVRPPSRGTAPAAAGGGGLGRDRTVPGRAGDVADDSVLAQPGTPRRTSWRTTSPTPGAWPCTRAGWSSTTRSERSATSTWLRPGAAARLVGANEPVRTAPSPVLVARSRQRRARLAGGRHHDRPQLRLLPRPPGRRPPTHSSPRDFRCRAVRARMTSARCWTQGGDPRTLDVGSLSEACVVHDAPGALYVAEEDVAIWRYDLDPSGGASRGRHGLRRAAAAASRASRWRAAQAARCPSSPPARATRPARCTRFLDGWNAFRGTFAVEDSPGPTARVTPMGSPSVRSFGPAFPNGLLVVHDASNAVGRRRVSRRLLQVRAFRPCWRISP